MIIPAQSQNLQVKPRWVAPVGVMESVVAYNCRKYGMPRPVLAMLMWEGAGNRAIDLSGHSNHGLFVNTPEWVADGLDFDGSTPDYIDVPGSDSISLTGTMTVSAWINPTDFTNYNGIASKTNGAQAAPYDFYLVQATGIPRFRRSISSNANSAPQTGQMNHIAVSVDSGNTSTHYLNGAPNGASTTGTRTDVGKSLRIGSRDDLFTKFKGVINNVIIYNIDLTTAQIKFLYDNPYFMYWMPEELYGYVAGAPPIGNPFWYYEMLQKRNR